MRLVYWWPGNEASLLVVLVVWACVWSQTLGDHPRCRPTCCDVREEMFPTVRIFLACTNCTRPWVLQKVTSNKCVYYKCVSHRNLSQSFQYKQSSSIRIKLAASALMLTHNLLDGERTGSICSTGESQVAREG